MIKLQKGFYSSHSPVVLPTESAFCDGYHDSAVNQSSQSSRNLGLTSALAPCYTFLLRQV
jgi:hypothetical protein